MTIFSKISISGLLAICFFLLTFFSGLLGLNFILHKSLAFISLTLVLIHFGFVAYKNYKFKHSGGGKK